MECKRVANNAQVRLTAPDTAVRTSYCDQSQLRM